MLAGIVVIFVVKTNSLRTSATTDPDQLIKLQVDLAASQATCLQLEQQVQYLQTELENERQLRRTEIELAQKERETAKETESQVLRKLEPVAQNLAKMQQKVDDIESQRSKQHGSLEELLKQTRDSEKELREVAGRLANTLTPAQARGAWGEMQLKRILEYVGLLDHVDFDTQVTIQNSDFNVRPDVVVYLPDGKSIPIDAKAPFDAYFEASNIAQTAGDEMITRKNSLLKKHSQNLRNHITALSDKKYWEALQLAPDFVVAFIPSESLLSGALEIDSALLEYAFERRVALASPVTLWAILKSVAYAWNQEEKINEISDILEIAKQLYKNVGVIAKHSVSLAKSLDKAVDSYNAFASSIDRNFITTGRRLAKLDLSVELAEPHLIEKQTREFVKDETSQAG